MLNISIDINPLVQKISMSQEEINSFGRMIIDAVAASYMQRWEEKVNDLGQTRRAYKLGMDFRYTGEFSGEFVLEGKGASRIAMMIEEGASAFDIKEGMERSSKKKIKKDGGWYMTVPMRQATPEAVMDSEIFSGRLPESVYNEVKKTNGQPLKAVDLPEGYDKPDKRPVIREGQRVIAEYKHKSPIYEGLKKSAKPQHSGYATFRRISDKSDENSWIHKGFSKHDFMGKTMQEIESELPDIIRNVKERFLDIKFS